MFSDDQDQFNTVGCVLNEYGMQGPENRQSWGGKKILYRVWGKLTSAQCPVTGIGGQIFGWAYLVSLIGSRQNCGVENGTQSFGDWLLLLDFISGQALGRRGAYLGSLVPAGFWKCRHSCMD